MTFQAGVAPWLARHLPGPGGTALRVLDVGAGQGTQALRLAAAGHAVTAVDPDARMRSAFADALTAAPSEVAGRVSLVEGALGGLREALGGEGPAYDVVLCHGVLMYLEDPAQAVRELASLVAPRGMLSLLARNADGMALRPGLRRDWAGVLAALDEAAGGAGYVNGLGVTARADHLEHLAALVSGHRLSVEGWYGVRVLTDGVGEDEPVPDDPAELAALLDAEERVGMVDPYRRVAALTHLVARRTAETAPRQRPA